jgi:Raf kinase inhibitor-like YbhB/YbcL family protein
MAFTLVSESFQNNGIIPARYTCDGWDMSPPLLWTHVPTGAKSLALIIHDLDAPNPDSPQFLWMHWLLYNIPPNIHQLAEGITKKDLPAGALQGKNDWGRAAYGGPCPPRGKHRYLHKLYALDVVLPDLKTPTKAVFEKAIVGHVIGHAELLGLYQRART